MPQNASFTEKITIGHLEYLLKYTGYDVELAYVNQLHGNRRRINSGLQFYGDEPDLIVEDLNLNTNAFALMCTILPIMAYRMAAQQPSKFTLHANSKRKIAPYQRFARRLHRYLSHLYELELDSSGAIFHYRKQPKSERNNLPIPTFEKN